MRSENNLVERTVLFIVASGVLAQSPPTKPAPTPKFEVVSIRVCDAKDHPTGVSGSPGRVTVPCSTVKNLIDWTYAAYANGPHFNAKFSLPVEGAPPWIDSDRYTINAKAPGTPGILAMFTGPLMQTLLADRFELKLHRETRQVPVYALTVGKGSQKFQPASPGSCDDWENPLDNPIPTLAPEAKRRPMCRILRSTDAGLEADGTTMKELGALFPLDRPVIDRSGVAGKFDIHVDLSYSDLGVPSDVAANATGQRQRNRPTLDDPADRFDAVRTALRKIGLDLQATKGPQGIIVIDHVQRPSCSR
jgi:uncharacterized protein (TIGR03435 family)